MGQFLQEIIINQPCHPYMLEFLFTDCQETLMAECDLLFQIPEQRFFCYDDAGRACLSTLEDMKKFAIELCPFKKTQL